MKLKSFRVINFRSIRDSGHVEVEKGQTCLVGKNESGKTALLEALYRTNPVVPEHAVFDPVVDYPKSDFTYIEDVEAGRRKAEEVVEVVYELDKSEKDEIAALCGKRALLNDQMTRWTRYGTPGSGDDLHHVFRLELSTADAMNHLIRRFGANPSQLNKSTWKALADSMAEFDGEGDVDVLDTVKEIAGAGGLSLYFYRMFWDDAPKFMYFNEYYQMTGAENLDALMEREESGNLKDSDYPLLGFIRLSGVNTTRLRQRTSTTDLINRLTGASHQITDKVMQYWSQNKHLKVVFDVREGNPDDPEEMRDSTSNLLVMIEDTVHGGQTPIDRRSRGFVWFFSFVAWYSHIRKEFGEGVILLLDEPGLSLHGKAQHDLLRYFDNELAEHQVVYTTHSPFMFSIDHPESIRVVQDRSIDETTRLPEGEGGTKVVNDLDEVWTTANGDTLFPLLTAMGIELWQMDIVSKNRLIVEGSSDKDYLDAMSSVLERKGKSGLSRRWLVLQAGGKTKVSPIVSMFDAQKGLNVAVLLDVGTENEGKIDDLYKKKLLKKSNVVRVSRFTPGTIADIEDMFERDFYVDLVNRAYGKDAPEIAPGSLQSNEPRTVKAVEGVWQGRRKFSHLRPARYFAVNLDEFADSLSEGTISRFEKLFETLNGLLKK
ncbi:MAG: AAA family ATPase [Gammaproteobacteria bacterium]|nr:AAA family ATPase [Gammaproteobacteria bacterium]